MNFSIKERQHTKEELIWFDISTEPSEFNDLQSESAGESYYSLNLFIQMQTCCLLNGKLLKFGISEGILEFYLVNCKLLRNSWTLLPDIKNSVSIKTKKTDAKNLKLGGVIPQSFSIEAGGSKGVEEETIYELMQVEMRGTEKDPYIEFIAQQGDRDGNLVFNGKFEKILGMVVTFASDSEIHAKFRVDVDGLCVTHYDGKPMKSNLILLLNRFSSKLLPISDPIQEALQKMAGNLSYVKLYS